MSVSTMAYHGGVDLGGMQKLKKMIYAKQLESPGGRVRAGIRAARAQLIRACALLQHASELAVAVLPLATGAAHMPTGLEARALAVSFAQGMQPGAGAGANAGAGVGPDASSTPTQQSSNIGSGPDTAAAVTDLAKVGDGAYALDRTQAHAIQLERQLIRRAWCGVFALYLPPPRGSVLAELRGVPWI